MPNTIIPTDVYTIVNAASKEMFGADTTIQARDTSSFVSVGEKMLRTGYTNTLNALTMVIGRTMIAVRPYRGKFALIRQDYEEFAAITRKISYYENFNEASQNFNTDLNPNQLEDGQSIDHYKIKKQYPLELNFVGLQLLQKHYTRWEEQLKGAFHSESEFAEFVRGLAVQVGNELETIEEAKNRLMVLNHIGGVYNIGNTNMKVNLTKGFNAKYGTTYTSEELRTEHFKEFLEYFISTIKYTMDMLTERNTLFHVYPPRNDDAGNALILNRHTPKYLQRLMLLNEFYIDAQARVLPEIFNDSYLKLPQFEAVNYWQNPNDPAAVSVTPNQLNVTTGQSEKGAAVEIPYVLGILFDRDAIMSSTKFNKTKATPDNAAGDYMNIYYHWGWNNKEDYTENAVLFYMADETAGA